MARLRPGFWAVPLAILALGMAVGPLCAVGQAQQTASSSSGNQSWWDSTCSGVKQGFDNLCHPFTPAKPSIPAPKPEDDAVSLKSKGKAGVELYVAVAQLYEQSNRMAEAEQQYLLALKEKPDDLAAILGYAHLQEQVGKPNEAILLYQRAVKAYPRQASVHNNLGLCYARQNRLGEAVAAIGRAIQFDPRTSCIATTSPRCWSTREGWTRRLPICGKCTAMRRPTTTWATC